MTQPATHWLLHLETLRPYLSGRDHRGKKGSLRWLEAAIAERGGKAGTVRNILYKDLGAPEEKLRLFEVIAELYQEAGLEPPTPPVELGVESARRSLGRDKRRILRLFTKALHQGQCPQIVVVGGAATGKGVLLSAVQKAVPKSLMVNLGGELAQQLYPLSERLGVQERLEALLAQFSPTQPYALKAALQGELRQALAEAINRQGLPLLLRAEADGELSGLPLRNLEGERVNLSVWLEPLLGALSVPYLVALTEPPPTLPYQILSPPTREESRRFVKDQLPDLPAERVDALVNQAGRNFGELQRLVLLEIAMAAAHTRPQAKNHSADLSQDPKLRPILQALAVLSPEADPAVPIPLLEQALGRRLEQLSQAERALFQPVGEGQVRPTLRNLLPTHIPEKEAQRLHRLALRYFSGGNLFRQLYHARGANELEFLLELLAQDPSRLSLMPGLWAESAGWSRVAERQRRGLDGPSLRERLATILVRYRAVLGQYAHPEALEALELLTQSPDPELRIWARVKAAEAQIDAGDYARALEEAPLEPELQGEVEAEGLLVRAALERWRGDYARAEGYVRRALALPTPPFLSDRVWLWQGLVAKDAGRFEEALEALSRVGHEPLLVGRARYQMGDLLMRIGRAEEAARYIREALENLETHHAPREEIARVRARLGTAYRRLGQYEEAARLLYQAIQEAPDPFTRTRAQSEASILESARGHPWEALQLAALAERYLRTTPERPSEARYRHLRTRLRLATAYWVAETNNPYRAPFRGGGKAPKALELLEALWAELREEATSSDRYTALRLDTAQMLALLKPAEEAQSLLRPFLGLSDAYHRTQARLSYAEALCRSGKWGEVLAQLLQMDPTANLPDPGLRAWRIALEAQALLGLGQEEAARRRTLDACSLPEPFRAQVGRVLGALWPVEALEAWIGTLAPLTPADALAIWLATASHP